MDVCTIFLLIIGLLILVILAISTFNEKTGYEIMFGLIKKMLIGLLTGLVNHNYTKSNHTKNVLLSNQKCMIQPTLVKLHLMNTVKKYITIHLRLN